MRSRNRSMAVAAAGILTVILIGVSTAQSASEPASEERGKTRFTSPPAGVCPPFHLRDEDGKGYQSVER